VCALPQTIVRFSLLFYFSFFRQSTHHEEADMGERMMKKKFFSRALIDFSTLPDFMTQWSFFLDFLFK
jgi:hypothetical protein